MSDSTFKAWLNGAKATERSVEIVQDGGLSGRWDDWLRRFSRAQSQDKAASADRAAGETSELATLTTEGEELLALIEGSRTVWYVRGLQTDVLQAIKDAHPEPTRTWERFSVPRPVASDNPTEKQAEAYLTAAAAWEEERALHNDEVQPLMEAWLRAGNEAMEARKYEQVSRAFVRAEQNGETLFTELSADDARALHKTIGDGQFKKILETVGLATATDGESPGEAGFLSRVSAVTQGLSED